MRFRTQALLIDERYLVTLERDVGLIERDQRLAALRLDPRHPIVQPTMSNLAAARQLQPDIDLKVTRAA